MKRILAALALALCAHSAYAINAFEFRGSADNVSKATMDTLGNVVFLGSGTFQGLGGLVTPSSVTASGFFGNGAAITAITPGNISAGTAGISVTGSASLNVLKTGDTMTGQLTNTSTITVQGNAFSVGGATLTVVGGNVGIGTASPGYKLTVAPGSTGDGIGIYGGNFAPALSLATSTVQGNTVTLGMAAANGQFSSDAAVGDGVIRVTPSGSFMLQSGSGASAIYVNPTNKVGIGTASPKTGLQAGSGGFGVYIDPNSTGFGGAAIGFNTYFDGAAFQTGTATSSGTIMYQDSTGQFYIRQMRANAAASNYAVVIGTSQSVGINNAGAIPRQSLDVVGNAIVSGSVGIGTADPCSTCTLHVVGGISLTGTLANGWEQVSNNCGAGVTSCTVTCSTGKVILGGGCNTNGIIQLSYPSGTNSWICGTTVASTIISHAMCARTGP